MAAPLKTTRDRTCVPRHPKICLRVIKQIVESTDSSEKRDGCKEILAMMKLHPNHNQIITDGIAALKTLALSDDDCLTRILLEVHEMGKTSPQLLVLLKKKGLDEMLRAVSNTVLSQLVRHKSQVRVLTAEIDEIVRWQPDVIAKKIKEAPTEDEKSQRAYTVSPAPPDTDIESATEDQDLDLETATEDQIKAAAAMFSKFPRHILHDLNGGNVKRHVPGPRQRAQAGTRHRAGWNAKDSKQKDAEDSKKKKKDPKAE